MTKTGFEGINTKKLYEEIEAAAAIEEEEAEQPEQIGAKRNPKGQGRAFNKRINMAFSDDNFEFIKIMSMVTGNSMTSFTNLLIDAYKNEHPEILEQARQFIAVVNSGAFSQLKAGAAADQNE